MNAITKKYEEIKERYPNYILLFRVENFYETFSEDAVATANILGLTLTKRENNPEPPQFLCGFPCNKLDDYLIALIRAGKRVAICEQIKN